MTRVAAGLLVGMVLVLGICLLDGDEQAGQDLCLAFLMLAHASDVGHPLEPAGRLTPVPSHGAPLASLDRPVPPPRA
jgi:hypothetical protein